MLVACYHFPPDAAVGALRPARFARVLPEFGWRPCVLTTDTRSLAHTDPGRLTGLEGVKIRRLREFPGIGALSARIKNRFAPPSADERREAEPGSRVAPGRPAGLRRLAVASLMLLDGRKTWATRAALSAVRWIHAEKIDCLLTSSPPASVHLIGLIAQAMTNVRWIADLRDPWVESLEARPPRGRTTLTDRIEQRMERLVVTRAARVVTTSGQLRNALLARYPEVPAERVCCVPNGIDPHPAPASDLPKYDVFTITYAGSLYEGRTPEPLFRALAMLVNRGALTPAAIRVNLIGHCATIDGVDTRILAERYGLGGAVDVVDFMPRAEVMRVLRRSHVLLVLAPQRHNLIVPAKLYDYLAAGTPILAVAEAGATTDFVRETGSGRAFAHADVEALSEYLSGLISGRGKADAPDPAQWRKRYDAVRLTGDLAAEMAALVPQVAVETRQ